MRFADGIVARREDTGPLPFSYEILFRPWGQVICVGNAWCVSKRWYRRLAPLVTLSGRISMALQSAFRFLPGRAQWKLTDRIRGLGNRVPRLLNRFAWKGAAGRPETLLCVIGNPQPTPVEAEISVSGFGNSQGGRSFRRVATLQPGWTTVAIPVAEIEPVIDMRGLFRVCFVPLIEKPAMLQIYYLGFVAGLGAGRLQTEAEKNRLPARKVKALVLDLDNTLWDGILIENPEADRRVFPGCREALEELDRRGILLSIASRNHFEDARRALEKLDLWKLFLYPQIRWEPKSAGIREIARLLNIGLDAVAFVDDSEFERAEVRAALPEVRTWDAAQLARLPEQEAFDVPVTDESRGRRMLYQQEQSRQSEFSHSAMDYDAFLATCGMVLNLEPLGEETVERVAELVQRTNQLNFSGIRYAREDLRRVAAEPRTLPVVMRCQDRFGGYGIVGFSILRHDGDALEMSDLMFSCRVQGKKVEHSYLSFLAAAAEGAGYLRLRCRYNRTDRNAPAGRVFEDLRFERQVLEGGREVRSLQCGKTAVPSFPARVTDSIGILARLAEWRRKEPAAS